MNSFKERLHHVIPGGAHTYSRGDDQFPSNAPTILESGEGAWVKDPNGKKYLDSNQGNIESINNTITNIFDYTDWFVNEYLERGPSNLNFVELWNPSDPNYK